MAQIESVAVVGTGIMGSGIAQTFARAGLPVRIFDRDPAATGRALERIEHGKYGLRRGVELGKVEASEIDLILGRLQAVTDLAAACEDVDLVVEAVYEDLGVKIRVFTELDQVAPAKTVLASNTSGFSIGALAGATARPDRVIGWHWAAPPPIMRLAEIVRHPGISEDTVNAVVQVATRIGKNPVVVNDQPLAWGFVANRIYGALAREAHAVVREGVATPEQVDTLLKDSYRWPVGPFEMGEQAVQGWDTSQPGMDVSKHSFKVDL